MKKIITVSLALLTTAALFGCSSGNSSIKASAPIEIGVVAPLTGSEASYGESFKNGTALAVKQVNDAGGISGRKVQIDLQDDQGDSKQAVNIANQYSSNKNILAVAVSREVRNFRAPEYESGSIL